MTTSAFSAYWHRVCDLTPQLTPDVRVERRIHRGERWYTLDGERGRAIRLNAAAYAFVGRLDGERSIQQIWEALNAADPAGAPGQDDVIRVLSELNARRLLKPRPGSDFDTLFRGWSEDTGRARQSFNPVAMRFVLGNPQRVLAALDPLAQRLFRVPMLVLWMLVVGCGAVLAAANGQTLYAHAATWMASPRYVLLALAVYPVIKAVHELAHGLALRRWGCEVKAFGVTLFLLMPLPFVDASGASSLREPSRRIAISAAGIMAELLIAACALVLWLNAQPGMLREAAFVIAFTASVSTLLVNANPLLRFDGYYMLVDALDLPNLASRSARYWGERLRCHVLRVDAGSTIVPARGERLWLLAYAPLSWAFRFTLCLALTIWVGSFSLVLGAAVGALFAVMLFMPVARGLVRAIRATAPGSRTRFRAAAAMGAAGTALALVLTAVPLPFGTTVQGVVWLPENARVRAETDGFVAAVLARDGARVAEGDVLIEMENPRLTADRARLAARVTALETELFQALSLGAGNAANVVEELERAKADVARVEERIAGLTLRAGCDGTFSMPRQSDAAGAFARQGAMLGHIVPEGERLIRVAVPEEEAVLVSLRNRAVRARLASDASQVLAGTLERDPRAAVGLLPSAALSVQHGGDIVTEAGDKGGLKPLSPVVLIDVRLAGTGHDRFGERAWVRFDYGSAPLAGQWLRRARQVFLRHFQPGV